MGAKRIVTGYSLDTGGTERHDFAIHYADARWHRLGRGWLGFGERTVVDLDTGQGTLEVFDNKSYEPSLEAFPYPGQPTKILRWTPIEQDGEQKVELAFTTILHQWHPSHGGDSYYTLPVYRRERREHGTTSPGDDVEQFARDAYYGYAQTTRISESVHAVLDIDDFGNATAEKTCIGRELDFINPAKGADTIEEVTRVFDNDEAGWLIAKLKAQEHCSTAGQETACRQLTRDYDPKGRLQTTAWGTEGDEETQVSVSFARDGFGNITKTVALDAFEGRRATCTSYEPEGYFPYAQKNPAGHLTYTKQHAGHGGLVAEVDPNALATQWALDGFGQAIREKRPDGTETTVTLTRTKDGGVDGHAFNVKQWTTATGAGTVVNELDGVGRVVRQWSPGVQTGATVPPRILEEDQYEPLGRFIAKRLVATAENTPQNARHYHSFEHDALGRPTKQTTPWGAATRYVYEGFATYIIEEPSGRQTIAEADALGKPTKITDARKGVTAYTYGPFGYTTSVLAPGDTQATTMQRDAFGRVRMSVEPDRGKTEFRRSGFGDVYWTRDALGREVSFPRDKLGRTVQRIDMDPNGTIENTYFTYDAAAKGKGKIAEVTSPNGHLEKWTYDFVGRPSSRTLTIGADNFSIGFGFDPEGRLSKVTYPPANGGARPAVC